MKKPAILSFLLIFLVHCLSYADGPGEKNPENKNTRQQLEPAEEIEIILIEQEKIKDFLLAQNKTGIAISTGVWFLINGFN